MLELYDMRVNMVIDGEIVCFTFYKFECESEYKARQKAKQMFIDDFCNGSTKNIIKASVYNKTPQFLK